MKKWILAGLILGLAGLPGNRGYAVPSAPITFGSPTTFTNDTILISGPLVYAVSVGNAAPVLNVGPQGITFQADGSNTNANVVFNPMAGAFGSFTGYLQSGSSGNAPFDTVLNSGGYNSTTLAGTNITLNNLVANRTYQLQIIVDDTRTGTPPNTFTVTSNATTTAPIQFAYAGSTTTLGAYVVGNFTANSTSETFQENAYLSGNPALDDFQVNGIVLDVANYNLTNTPGLTPNQYAIATNLDQTSLSGLLGPVITAIATGNPSAIGGDLDQLSPEKFSEFTSITAFNNASFETEAMDNYLASLRAGSNGTFIGGNGGIDSRGLQVNDPNYDPALAQVHSRLLAWNAAPYSDGLISDTPGMILGGVDMKDSKDMKSMVEPAYGNPWNFFVRGNVILAQGFSQTGVPHFDDNTESVTLGTDYRITPNFLVGLTAAYAHTDVTLDPNGSSATVDSYSPGLFASYADHGWYANVIGSYVHNAYTQNRVIGFIGQTATSAPEGNEGVADLDGGYDFHQGALTFGPLAGVQYTHLTVDGYNESGSVADLTVNQDQSDSVRSRLGGRISFNCTHCGLTFIPHLDAAWQHEFLDQSRGITSQFDNSGAGSFSVRTNNPSRDSALVDAGLDADINQTVSVFVDYVAQAGQDDYFGQSVQAGVKIGF